MDEIALGQKLTDDEAMALAMHIAKKGLGFVSPNPAVGCVILDNTGSLLAHGYHEKYGEAHAEINALKKVSSKQLIGARMFVTLEPCAHHGKTPPCAEAIAKLPLSEVIFGIYDPNPLVKGKGASIIQTAGIKATHYAKEQEALERVCEHFLRNMRAQLPFVSIKCATSLDGKLALKSGQSKWITGAEARLEGHFLRATHDAILVGVNTFLADDPSLDVRHPSFPDKRNRVLVLDLQGQGIDKLSSAKLLESHAPEEIFWVIPTEVNSSTLDGLGVKTLRVPTLTGTPTLDLKTLKEDLWNLGIRSILVEGGAGTISEFINQKAADRLFLFTAPIIVGEQSGLSWTAGVHSIDNLTHSIALSPLEMTTFGKDSLFTARFL